MTANSVIEAPPTTPNGGSVVRLRAAGRHWGYWTTLLMAVAVYGTAVGEGVRWLVT